MGKEITEEEVDMFLLRNPEFVRSWLSCRGLGDLAEHLYRETVREKTAISFINFLQNILFQKELARRNTAETFTTNEMFREIVKILNYELDVDSICHKILKCLCILLRCEKASLFMARGTGKTQYLMSALFDVTSESTLEETLHTEENAIRIPFGKGIAGFVAQNKCLVNVKDAYQDPRFLIDVDNNTGFRTKSLLCMPIIGKGDTLLAVAQVINKRHDNYFDSEDENIFESFLAFCSVSMNNNNFFQKSFEEYIRHHLLLKLNRCILEYQNSLPKLISEITKLAMEMLCCECISIYLIDPKKGSIRPNKSSKVFQLLKGESDISEEIIAPNVREVIEQNMNSGHSLDMIHWNESKESDTIRLKSEFENEFLCLAIKDAGRNFVGWIVYIKDSMDGFSQNDINMIEMFTMFCGLAIYNCRLYETAANMLSQLEFTNEILSQYTTCDPITVNRLLSMQIENSSFYQIYEFRFNDFLYSDDDTVLLAARMFLEANILSILNISIELLFRWLLTVKKNYRPVIYHNWRHAVNVTQIMFCMLTTGKLQTYFSEFEQICLLMASMCHDLDHRGCNNSFQVKTASPLATLYSTSVLENHHINRCIRILKNEDTNIFRNLSAEKYQQALKLIEKAILSTDLVIYFERRNIFKRKLEVDDQTLATQESIDLLISMMMTASDLSAITKPWDIQKRTAVMVAAEFFEQGDLESQYKYTVLPMMDRNKRHELAKMQVGFIDFVCTIVYKLLVQVREELTPLYDGMLNNRVHWSDIANGKEEFDVDKELELVLHNISLNSAIGIGGNCQEQYTDVSTQTNLTFDRIQNDTQTDISIPADICQTETAASRAKRSVKAVEIKTADSQTEEKSLKVSSVITQTEKVSLRESEHLPLIMPHEQPVLTLDTTNDTDIGRENKFLNRKSQSNHAQSTITIPINTRFRRTSWIDEVAEDRRNEILQSNSRKSSTMGVPPEEGYKPFKRISRIFLPPNAVRQRQPSSEYESSKDMASKESIVSYKSSQTSVRASSSKVSSVESQVIKRQSIKETERRPIPIQRLSTQLINMTMDPDLIKRKCVKVNSKTKPAKKSFLQSKLCMIS